MGLLSIVLFYGGQEKHETKGVEAGYRLARGITQEETEKRDNIEMNDSPQVKRTETP